MRFSDVSALCHSRGGRYVYDRPEGTCLGILIDHGGVFIVIMAEHHPQSGGHWVMVLCEAGVVWTWWLYHERLEVVA